jgi:hypothetical protein
MLQIFGKGLVKHSVNLHKNKVSKRVELKSNKFKELSALGCLVGVKDVVELLVMSKDLGPGGL